MSQEKITIRQGVHHYLLQLRETGAINMFGAAPYLVRDLGMDKKEADEIVQHWVFGNFEVDYEH